MLSDNDVDFEYLVGGTLPAEYVYVGGNKNALQQRYVYVETRLKCR